MAWSERRLRDRRAQRSLAHLHIVISVMSTTGELSDDDLKLVAGGITGHLACVGCSAGQYPRPS